MPLPKRILSPPLKYVVLVAYVLAGLLVMFWLLKWGRERPEHEWTYQRLYQITNRVERRVAIDNLGQSEVTRGGQLRWTALRFYCHSGAVGLVFTRIAALQDDPKSRVDLCEISYFEAVERNYRSAYLVRGRLAPWSEAIEPGPLGFRWLSTRDSTGIGSDRRQWALRVPHWAIALALCLPPILPARQLLRTRYRRRHGLCPACNYDLRASNDRCPECGTPIPPPAAPAQRSRWLPRRRKPQPASPSTPTNPAP